MKSSKPVRVLLVGNGFIGATYLDIYLRTPGVQVVALSSTSRRGFDRGFVEIDGNIGEKIQVPLAGIQLFEDPLKMIAEVDADVVDICSPTYTRVAMIEAALAANRHIFCEKPLAGNPQTGNKIYELVKRAGEKQIFTPKMCVRYWPQYAEVLEIARSQTYGKLLSGRMLRQAAMPTWSDHFADGEESGGGLYDLLTHEFDYILKMRKGELPLRITANNPIGMSGRVDAVQAFLQYRDGASIFLEGGWRVPASYGFRAEFEFVFEHATVSHNAKGLRICRNDAKDPEILKVAKETGWELMTRHNIDCVAKGIKPELGIQQGVDALHFAWLVERARP